MHQDLMIKYRNISLHLNPQLLSTDLIYAIHCACDSTCDHNFITLCVRLCGCSACCKIFVQPIFSLFSMQNADICTPTENHKPSTALDSVGINGSGISVVSH